MILQEISNSLSHCGECDVEEIYRNTSGRSWSFFNNAFTTVHALRSGFSARGVVSWVSPTH